MISSKGQFSFIISIASKTSVYLVSDVYLIIEKFIKVLNVSGFLIDETL